MFDIGAGLPKGGSEPGRGFAGKVTMAQCREALAFCRQNGMTICARGAGRGYGDLALNNGHALLDMSAMNRIIEFDEGAAQITVEAGMRLIDIYQAVHHRLLTLPGSPTEKVCSSSTCGRISAAMALLSSPPENRTRQRRSMR